MGWKSILLPIFESPELTSPSAKLRSKRENNAHTSESGFESFLAVSARSLSEAAWAPVRLPPGERDEREQTHRTNT